MGYTKNEKFIISEATADTYLLFNKAWCIFLDLMSDYFWFTAQGLLERQSNGEAMTYEQAEIKANIVLDYLSEVKKQLEEIQT